MSKSLKDALSDKAWSLSAVMFDLDDILDDEGRPISERRADSLTRVGVEMEMRLCPFGGIREGKWMNASALTQINQYYQDAIAELAAFRRHPKGKEYSWEDTLACVIELFAEPALYLLRKKDHDSPVPAKAAVCHKLAAGMFGVMSQLLERLALGAKIPVSADAFMDLIDETGALVGASEACAGSPKMIRKVSEALLEPSNETSIQLEPSKIEIGRLLALQVQLGTFWRLYDRARLHSLVAGEFRPHLAPRNNFLERKLDLAAASINSLPTHSRPNYRMLPDTLNAQGRLAFVAALNDAADFKALEEDKLTAITLLNEQGGAVLYNGNAEKFALGVANYLNAYRLFQTELCKLELELRKILEYPLHTPIRLGSAVFPSPQALHWYELVLGRKLGDGGHLTGAKIKVAKRTG